MKKGLGNQCRRRRKDQEKAEQRTQDAGTEPLQTTQNESRNTDDYDSDEVEPKKATGKRQDHPEQGAMNKLLPEVSPALTQRLLEAHFSIHVEPAVCPLSS